MAVSKCPRESCNKSNFEVKELTVRDSPYRLVAIQCASCGSVVSVNEFLNIGSIISKIAEKIGVKI